MLMLRGGAKFFVTFQPQPKNRVDEKYTSNNITKAFSDSPFTLLLRESVEDEEDE